MTLDEFCHARGVDLAALPADVDTAIGLDPHDMLLVTGSLAEGLGDARSDVDLLLITPRAEGRLPTRDEIALVAGQTVVDVRILRTGWLDELLARFDEWRRAPWDIVHAAPFDLADRVLLHRLAHARTLWNDASRLAPRPAKEGLARLKLHVARQMSRTVQVDLAGHAETGDYESLVFAAQDLLGHGVDALVAGYGFSNPHQKWRPRLLSLLPSDWDASVTLRPESATAVERVWQLHRAPERPEARECLEHALRVSSFARAMFAWAERRAGLAAPAAVEHAWDRLPVSRAEPPLPYLDFDVDFAFSDEQVAVGRLNGFGDALRLSAGEFELALLCDGTTTAREAESVLAGRADALDLMARLAAAEFVRDAADLAVSGGRGRSRAAR